MSLEQYDASDRRDHTPCPDDARRDEPNDRASTGRVRDASGSTGDGDDRSGDDGGTARSNTCRIGSCSRRKLDAEAEI